LCMYGSTNLVGIVTNLYVYIIYKD
jgi:hypothetical protein